MNDQIFLVFDSLRWDLFRKAKTPYLKGLGRWKKAYTPGTYTLPAHASFFAGKLPQTEDKTDYYDSAALRFIKGKPKRNLQLWRLSNPEAPRPARTVLEGENIIEGFKNLGYKTIGTGAVNWFNPELPAGKILTSPFDHFAFFAGKNTYPHESAEPQIEFALDKLNELKSPYFLFINFGETHHRFTYKGCPWSDTPNPYGDMAECKRRQTRCIEYLDGKIRDLLAELKGYDLVICSDHGEAMGENGLWGHSFYHKKVMEVPLLIKLWEGAQ